MRLTTRMFKKSNISLRSTVQKEFLEIFRLARSRVFYLKRYFFSFKHAFKIKFRNINIVSIKKKNFKNQTHILFLI